MAKQEAAIKAAIKEKHRLPRLEVDVKLLGTWLHILTVAFISSLVIKGVANFDALDDFFKFLGPLLIVMVN
jgi:hypothetical protein